MRQVKARGRRALTTPRPLLLAMAKLMLVDRVPRWRAAGLVAASDAGRSFGKLHRIGNRDDLRSLSMRLDREFAPLAVPLLAEAGRMPAAARQRLEAREAAAIVERITRPAREAVARVERETRPAREAVARQEIKTRPAREAYARFAAAMIEPAQADPKTSLRCNSM